jgi:hypothetical protein
MWRRALHKVPSAGCRLASAKVELAVAAGVLFSVHWSTSPWGLLSMI